MESRTLTLDGLVIYTEPQFSDREIFERLDNTEAYTPTTILKFLRAFKLSTERYPDGSRSIYWHLLIASFATYLSKPKTNWEDKERAIEFFYNNFNFVDVNLSSGKAQGIHYTEAQILLICKNWSADITYIVKQLADFKADFDQVAYGIEG